MALSLPKMAPEEFFLQSADRVRIAVNHYRAGETDAVLIVCHGFFKSKQSPVFDRISRAFAGGRDVLTIDFRGHGRSGGLFTFSARETLDLEALLAWAVERYRRIDLMGFSLGAAIAMNTAARHPQRIKRVVAVSGPAVFNEIEMKFWTMRAIRGGIKGMNAGSGCLPGAIWLKKDRPIESVKRLAGVPKLFIHGTNDVIISHHHSERLYAAAAEPKAIHIIKGGSHAEALFGADAEGFTEIVRRWLIATDSAT